MTSVLSSLPRVRGTYTEHAPLKDLVWFRAGGPADILFRKKEGFDIPAHDWFRGPLKPLLLDTLTERTVRENGLFRWEYVSRIIRNHLERRANLGYQLWGLLTLFLWMKRWGVQVEPAFNPVQERMEAVTSN